MPNTIKKIKQINIIKSTALLFIILNLILRFETFFYHNQITPYIFAIAAVICFFTAFTRKYTVPLLFIFGTTFFLYGFHSNSIYNLTFEYILCLVTLSLFISNFTTGTKVSCHSQTGNILTIYIVLTISSLFLLPLSSFKDNLFLYGFFGLADKIFLASSANYFYSIAGVNRLLLFFIFILQINNLPNHKTLYKTLFIGILTGTFCSIILGLCDYYGIISLSRFRHLDPLVNPNNIQYRLQSTFGHPGWFAEFVTITIPIILVGFFKKNRLKITTVLLFLILLLCEIALILAKARAGWISYPLTLFFCWLFFYSSEDNSNFSWHKNKAIVLKVCISIPITIVLSFLIIYIFFGSSSRQIHGVQKQSTLSKEEVSRIKHNSLHSRMATIFRVQDRLYLWEDGVLVGSESPIWGMGYESFHWQARKLATIPESHLSKKRKLKTIFGTPHNLYVQLFVSNGIVGLLIWCLLIVSTLYILIKNYISTREPFNIIVILSIIGFHIYGVFQSLQYIPVIWLLIFLNFGYTITLQQNTCDTKIINGWRRWIGKIIALALVCAGITFYVSNAGSKKIYQTYGCNTNTGQVNYIGFYAPENWSGKTFRWTNAKAMIVIPRPGKFRLTFLCSNPDIKQSPVTVILKTGTKVLDRISFRKATFITKEYSLNLKEQNRLLIDVSRTWVPKKAGVNADTRKLGVAVSELKYLD